MPRRSGEASLVLSRIRYAPRTRSSCSGCYQRKPVLLGTLPVQQAIGAQPKHRTGRLCFNPLKSVFSNSIRCHTLDRRRTELSPSVPRVR